MTAPLLRLVVHGTPGWAERFWSKVGKGDACWEWAAGRRRDGYGRFWLGGRSHQAHRVVWLLANPTAEIGPGQVIRHQCDNPPCCRPDHLAIGTKRDNDLDRVRRGRSATGDNNGARLYPERLARGEANIQYRPSACRNGHPAERRYVSASGERCCTDCMTARRQRYRAKARMEGRRAY